MRPHPARGSAGNLGAVVQRDGTLSRRARTGSPPPAVNVKWAATQALELIDAAAPAARFGCARAVSPGRPGTKWRRPARRAHAGHGRGHVLRLRL